MTIFSFPENYGLSTVAEVNWIDECYQFDFTAVWQRIADGKFLYATDSGCSCPEPFEDTELTDLTECTMQEFIEFCERVKLERRYPYYGYAPDSDIAKAVEAMQKARRSWDEKE